MVLRLLDRILAVAALVITQACLSGFVVLRRSTFAVATLDFGAGLWGMGGPGGQRRRRHGTDRNHLAALVFAPGRSQCRLASVIASRFLPFTRIGLLRFLSGRATTLTAPT